MTAQDTNYNEIAAADFFRSVKPMHGPAGAMRNEFAGELKSKVLDLHLTNITHKPTMLSKFKSLFGKKAALAALGGFFCMLIIAGGTLVLFNKKDEQKSKQPLKGELSFVEGEVEYQQGDMGWKSASAEMTLEEGMQLRVNGEGKAIVALDDGSAVRLNADSAITLSSLDPNHILITNNSGEVYTRVVKAERTFEVATADATYKSLGTAYKTVNTTAKKGVEVYHSKVAVTSDKIETDITVEEGNKYYLSENKLEALTAEDLAKDEFIQWNKTQDEKNAEFKSQLGVLQDTTGPALTLLSPADGTKTTDSKINVTGTTEAGSTVKINGEVITLSGETFAKEVALKDGENVITVDAYDASGNKTSKSVKVIKETQQAAPTPTKKPSAPATGIKLTGSQVSGGVKLSWTVTNLNTSNGFKVVKSLSPNPTYGEDEATYIAGDKTSYTWSITDGKKYYFKVCTYTGSGCNNYSNEVAVTAPNSGGGSTVTSLSLSHVNGTKVSWSVNGTHTNGYKVVWSKNANPTYPLRAGDQYNYETSNMYSFLNAFDGPGTYYVRVCAYHGSGSCTPYSNQIEVVLE